MESELIACVEITWESYLSYPKLFDSLARRNHELYNALVVTRKWGPKSEKECTLLPERRWTQF
jgi:hypothetical protein